MIFQLEDRQVRALNTVAQHTRKTLEHHQFLHFWFYYKECAFATDGATLLLCDAFVCEAEATDYLYAFAPVRVTKARTEHMLTFNTETARVAGLKSEQQELVQMELSPTPREALARLIDLHKTHKSREQIGTFTGFSANLALLGRITEALTPLRFKTPVVSYLNFVRVHEGTYLLARWHNTARVEALTASRAQV